jgi:hypothetical protein
MIVAPGRMTGRGFAPGVSGPLAALSLMYGVGMVDAGGGLLSAWGGATAAVGQRPLVNNTAGSRGVEFDGTDDRMALPATALTATAGWTLILDYTQLASKYSYLANGTANRIFNDSHFIVPITSTGSKLPGVSNPATGARRLNIIRGDATFWRAYLNGGTGGGASTSIGDLTLSHLAWDGASAAQCAPVRFHAVLAYQRLLTVAETNDICAGRVALNTDFGALSYTSIAA